MYGCHRGGVSPEWCNLAQLPLMGCGNISLEADVAGKGRQLL